MKKAFFLLTVCSTLYFTACNDSSDSVTNNTPNNIQDDQLNALLESAAVPLADTGSTNTSPQMQNSTAALNPPHGEPGHDCAIPVGAPLNSPAGNNNASSTAAPATNQPQLNPPHGEPGHDCAVPVGAPLN